MYKSLTETRITSVQGLQAATLFPGVRTGAAAIDDQDRAEDYVDMHRNDSIMSAGKKYAAALTKVTGSVVNNLDELTLYHRCPILGVPSAASRDQLLRTNPSEGSLD